jgi:hypothetical protein
VDVVAPEESFDEGEGDELAVCAEEQLTDITPSTAAIDTPPTILIRNKVCFMDCLRLVSDFCIRMFSTAAAVFMVIVGIFG